MTCRRVRLRVRARSVPHESPNNQEVVLVNVTPTSGHHNPFRRRPSFSDVVRLRVLCFGMRPLIPWTQEQTDPRRGGPGSERGRCVGAAAPAARNETRV